MQRVTGPGPDGHTHTYTPRGARTTHDDGHSHPLKVINGVVSIGESMGHTHAVDVRDRA